jgi:hypothetical protein
VQFFFRQQFIATAPDDVQYFLLCHIRSARVRSAFAFTV